jgi:two-component system OmpR family response regulator
MTDKGSQASMPERILVVSHEPAMAARICWTLLDAGYDATMENSSFGAIQKAKEFAPHLLIIDPVMPVISGVDAAKRIARQSGCNVLFISTGAAEDFFPEVLDELRNQGCDCDAFPLPFEKEYLLMQVRNQIERRSN